MLCEELRRVSLFLYTRPPLYSARPGSASRPPFFFSFSQEGGEGGIFSMSPQNKDTGVSDVFPGIYDIRLNRRSRSLHETSGDASSDCRRQQKGGGHGDESGRTAGSVLSGDKCLLLNLSMLPSYAGFIPLCYSIYRKKNPEHDAARYNMPRSSIHISAGSDTWRYYL